MNEPFEPIEIALGREKQTDWLVFPVPSSWSSKMIARDESTRETTDSAKSGSREIGLKRQCENSSDLAEGGSRGSTEESY